MSWKPMDTAPKDGTIIVVYADLTQLEWGCDVFHAFTKKVKVIGILFKKTYHSVRRLGSESGRPF